jgi:hypothetical protein
MLHGTLSLGWSHQETRTLDAKQRITIAMVIGAVIGAVLFALTDFPGWIGLGAGLGIIFGAGIARRRTPHDS